MTTPVTPLCPYFGTCGGCSTQHIAYEQQLAQKKQQLVQATGFEDVFVASDKEYFYRNRMDFIFHQFGIGLREKGHWDRIIDIDKCVIADEKVNALITEVRKEFKDCDYFDIRKQTGTFKYAVLRVSGNESAISFVLNEDSSRLSDAVERIKSFAEHATANNIIVTYVPHKSDVSIGSEFFVVKGSDELHAEYLGKIFSYSVQGFFQNNHAMAEKMHEYVKNIISQHDTSKMHLLDLYGGVGTFGIINAESFKTMLTVESVKECTDSALKNIEANNVKNGSAKMLDAKNIRKLTLEQPLFVITDPPRSGMDEKTIQHLNLIKPKVIIYVSCNIDQLRKDLPKFKEYAIKSAAMFDLFPQTPHAEGVIELVLK